MPVQELCNQYELNHNVEIDHLEFLAMMQFVNRVSLGGRVVSDEGACSESRKRKTKAVCMCLCRSCSTSTTWITAGR